MDTDEVISEIGTAMENLLEKDENGFSWDLENKVKLDINQDAVGFFNPISNQYVLTNV